VPSAHAAYNPNDTPKKTYRNLVKSGETVFSILKRWGFTPSQALREVRSGVLPKYFRLNAKSYYLALDFKHRRELRFYESETDRALLFWKEGTKSGSLQAPIKFEIKKIRVVGKIRGSLIASVQKHISDITVAYDLMDAFNLEYNLDRGLKKNAPFEFVIEKKYDHGKFVRYGRILSASLKIGNKLIEKLFVPFPGGGGAYMGRRGSPPPKPFYAPVNDIKISSKFKRRRYHPIKKRRLAHLGIDFSLPIGSPIFATQDGMVKKTGRTRGSGNFIILQHKNGWTSSYSHMEKRNAKMKPGLFVKAGDTLGRVGCTGYCTKPHLHYEIKRNGRATNPAPLLNPYPFHLRKFVSDTRIRSENAYDKIYKSFSEL